MINYDILAFFNTSNARLREVFTAEMTDDLKPRKGETAAERKARIELKKRIECDIETCERTRKRIQARMDEGIAFTLRNWRMDAAINAAWDTNVITKATLPLLMFAQGKINMEKAVTTLEALGDAGSRFVKEETVTPEVRVGDTVTQAAVTRKIVDVPRFVDTHINLIRSIIGRRHAAQTNNFNNKWPFYEYEARSTGLPAKCRADVLSQRVDMMVDQFDHRHHDGQCIRDGLLFARVLDFVRSSWETEKQYRLKDVNLPATGDNIEEVITKEGLGFINPPRSQTFCDPSHPPVTLNTDTGCEYCGFWTVRHYGDLATNPAYFNVDKVGYQSSMWGSTGVFGRYSDYFSHYQYTIIPPYADSEDPTSQNARTANVGLYSSLRRDASVLEANYFEKVVPKTEGFGDYPFPVWNRYVCAQDGTVMFAEILPSTPAAYLGINESDNRFVNVSMAMDLMSFQDQMTNLTTQMLLLCQMEMFKAIGINEDTLSKGEVEAIKKQLKGTNWATEPLVFVYSLAKMQELGIPVDKVIQIAETHQGQSINTIFESMMRLVELTEKLMALSPNEQGQPAPREISATEVTEISNTTSSVYSAISDCIDEFRAAKKRIIYESLVACGKAQIETPVKDRYTVKTIQEAGFEPKLTEVEAFRGGPSGSPRRHTVIGTPKALIHDYIFTTRDGAERAVNTQAANTLVQLIGQVLAVPSVAMAMGKEKLYELFNEVFRMSGCGVDLNLALKEGEDNTLGQDDMTAMKQALEQMQGFMQQMAGQIQKTAEGLAQQDQVNQEQEQQLALVNELAKRVQQAHLDIEEIRTQADGLVAKMIPYDKAPEDIKRQMEERAGFDKSTMPPVTAGKTAK